jgi:hypothetical protein
VLVVSGRFAKQVGRLCSCPPLQALETQVKYAVTLTSTKEVVRIKGAALSLTSHGQSTTSSRSSSSSAGSSSSGGSAGFDGVTTAPSRSSAAADYLEWAAAARGGSGRRTIGGSSNQYGSNCGFSKSEVEELRSQFVNPWDEDAAAVLAYLRNC